MDPEPQSGPAENEDRDARDLARFLSGDERGFEDLVRRYETRLRAVAYGVLRDWGLAEDAAQDAFLTAYRKAATFRNEGAFRGWLFRIVLNRARDLARARRRRAEEGADPATAAFAEGVETQHRLEAEWAIGQSLDTLRPEHRMALVLKEIEGMGYQEIADVLGWPLGTVQTRVHRARIELRDALARNRRET